MNDDRKCAFCRREVAAGDGHQVLIADRWVVFCLRDWSRACTTPTGELARILGIAAAIILIVPSALLQVIA